MGAVHSRGPVAAIDCGTNSTRLLLVDDRGRTLERQMRITRLGQGVDATGVLADEAVDRCVDVLTGYGEVLRRHGVARGRLVATSAVRDAANGEEFLARAARASGLVPEVLTGDEEGRLSMAGATVGLEPPPGPWLVVDIGGGSTELIAGRSAEDPSLAVVSMQMGCVRIAERFFHADPPTADELAAARAMVDSELDRAVAAHPGLATGIRLIGLAGTVATLASLDQGLAVYDRERVHHAVLSAATVARWHRTLAAETGVDRLRRPGMDPGREDVIVGGTLVLEAVMDRFGFGECLVSESDILDGLVASQR